MHFRSRIVFEEKLVRTSPPSPLFHALLVLAWPFYRFSIFLRKCSLSYLHLFVWVLFFTFLSRFSPLCPLTKRSDRFLRILVKRICAVLTSPPPLPQKPRRAAPGQSVQPISRRKCRRRVAASPARLEFFFLRLRYIVAPLS